MTLPRNYLQQHVMRTESIKRICAESKEEATKGVWRKKQMEVGKRRISGVHGPAVVRDVETR